MGGHGGLNILPQKSWHVYNRENREKVQRDEAKFEAVEKERRAKHRQAESEYRHAALLARVRGLPLDAARPSDEPQPADVIQDAPAQQEEQQPVVHDIMASKRSLQQADGHLNFWKEDELRAGNSEVRAEEAMERRRRGKAETQTSDARFDERFKLAHAMHGKANTPWYAAAGHSLLQDDLPSNMRPLDGGQLLAATARERIGGNIAAVHLGERLKTQKHKQKHKKAKKELKKQAKGSISKVDAKQQLKASVAVMRAEREAREAAERAREKQVLRRNFLA